ncbi:MAG: hypothetical protein LBE91_05115 [Tannerella sp.]|nr:hypothetical protein [Tannerella sp.]
MNISKSENSRLPETFHLSFQCRGQTIYSEEWNQNSEIMMTPENILPTGVIRILLSDSSRNPVSERLIFNTNNAEKTDTKFTVDKSEYHKREEVKASVEITDSENKPVKANFLISVIDCNITRYDTSINILSTLLLTSDLKGTIEDPAYYFRNESESTKEHLDWVMLTHGWTRYNVNKVIREEDFETSQTITGIIKGRFLNKNLVSEPVSLIVPEYGFFDKTTTDSTGKFRFDNFEFSEGTQYLLQSNKRADIFLDEEIYPAVNEEIIPTPGDDLPGFENRLTQAKNMSVFDSTVWQISLESVTVTAAKPEKKDRYHPFSSPFTKKIGSEEIERLHAPNLYQLLSGLSANITGSLLILVDNVEVGAKSLIGYSANNISSIEFLSTAHDKNIFAFGGNYDRIILITTKRIEDTPQTNSYDNTKVITPLGYQITKEFYSPVYQTKEQITDRKPDSRTTIYWNPDMRTGEDGKSKIHFYASDHPENYSVIIEGITEDGKMVYLVKDLENE